MAKFIDLTEQQFGRLTVVSINREHKSYKVFWNCLCSCGNTTIVPTSNLKNGHSSSCGCKTIEVSKTHGHSGKYISKTYKVWQTLKNRCLNPNDSNYKSYGGRGISLEDRWNFFENFLEDMGEAPEGLSIERIDNDKGYNKDNCKWASVYEQARNKRSNINITLDEITRCLEDWCKIYNINRNTVNARIRLGWSIQTALNTAGSCYKGKSQCQI
jgi:hypothetical protein